MICQREVGQKRAKLTPQAGIAAALAAQGWLTTQALDIGPVDEELDTTEMIVLLVTTTLFDELGVAVGVAEDDEELETGIMVDKVLPGATVDDEVVT